MNERRTEEGPGEAREMGTPVEPSPPNPKDKTPAPLLLWVLLGLTALLILIEPGRVPLFEPDEGRYAEIPREMLATFDFVVPRLNGLLYFEKPPLYYWAVAISLELFGPNEFAVRFPSKLATLLLLFLTYRFAKRRYGERTAVLSSLITGSSILVFTLARVATIDPSLSLAVAAAAFAFVGFAEAEAEGDREAARLRLFGLHIACAAAVMLKGLVGLVLPGGAILLFVLLTSRYRLIPRLFAPGPLVLFLILTVPWHVLVARKERDFLDFYFVNEHFNRFFRPGHAREGSILYFVAVLLVGFLPWTAFFGRLRETWPGSRLAGWRARPTEAFLWLYAIFGLVFFSVSRSKLIPYLEPIWPAVAVLLALSIERARRAGATFVAERRLLAVVFGVLFLVARDYAITDGLAKEFGIEKAAYFVLAVLMVGVGVNLCLRARQSTGASDGGLARLASAVAGPWLALLIGCLAALSPVAKAVTAWPVVNALLTRIQPGDLVFQRGHYVQSVPFYLGRMTPLVSHGKSELDFGRAHNSNILLFPTEAEFAQAWNGYARVFVVLHKDRKHDFHHPALDLKPPVEIAALRNGKISLVTNRP